MQHLRLRMRDFVAAALLLVTLLTLNLTMADADKPAKLSVPAATSLDDARKTVADVFKDELDKAKKPEEKAALAVKLLALADKGDDQAPGRFALYVTARDLACDSGDSKTAMQAIESMAEQFDFDAVAMKLETLNKYSKSPRTSPQRKEVADAAEGIARAAIAVDRDSAAEEAANLGLRMARLSGDPAAIAEAAATAKSVDELKAARAKLKNDLETLEKSPTDPAANLAVGKFSCFVKSDWEKGLPMLALGSDAELKGLAERDAKPPTEGEALATLGDDWWTLGDKNNGTLQRNIRIHAAAWYAEALPKITPFARVRIEKRIALLTPADHAAADLPSGAVLRRVLAIRHTDDGPSTVVRIKDLSFDIAYGGSRWAGCDAGFEFTSVRKIGLTIDEKNFPSDTFSTLALVVIYHTRSKGYGTSPTLLMLSGQTDMVRTCKLYTIQAQKPKPGAPPPSDGRAGDSGRLNFTSSADVPAEIYHTITRYNGEKNDLANVVNLPGEKHFDLDLAKLAPKDWDGGAWVIFNASNPKLGTATVRGHLEAPGVRLDKR